ncbi:MAG: tetraacyldisaccharide 4'-kinase [Actinobacteria bacterium]|nr:tetraacyldisaccharide 4'-kinase [Actinomycetota bacterium]
MRLLPDADSFRRLVDGSDRRPTAGILRGFLAAAAIPYAAAVELRNRAYDAGLLRTVRPDVPVVSIGNLTLGGTGKTPLVAWAARQFLGRGTAVAIVSRGYAARPGERSDEALELGLLLPGVPHVADRDRVAAVRRAATDHRARVVLLDDGFQHRRLGRSLDIVTIDATDPFGGGRIFPRGLLREPIRSLARADAVVVTRSDMADAATLETIDRVIAKSCGGRRPGVWAESRHGPTRLRSWSGTTEPVGSLAGRRVVAVSGIGNPAPFRATLERLGAIVVAHRTFPDHHPYDDADREAIGRDAARRGVEWVVTTLKDLVKLRIDRLGDVPLAAVEIELSITRGREQLERLLAGVPCAA